MVTTRKTELKQAIASLAQIPSAVMLEIGFLIADVRLLKYHRSACQRN